MKVSRLLELRTMPYRDYLQTEEWQAIRTEVLRRAKHRCQVCNSGYNLEVHHRTYENRGDEDMSDLTVLCDECHQIFHDAGKVSYTRTVRTEKTWYLDKDGKLIRA